MWNIRSDNDEGLGVVVWYRRECGMCKGHVYRESAQHGGSVRAAQRSSSVVNVFAVLCAALFCVAGCGTSTRADRSDEPLRPFFVDGKFGLVDANDTVIVPAKFDEVFPHSQTPLYPVKQNGKWGFVAPGGKVVIPFKFDEAMGFSEGLAAVALNGRWGYIDPKGTMKIEPRYVVLSIPQIHTSGFKNGIHGRIDQTQNTVEIDRTGAVVKNFYVDCGVGR